ncbi:9693_t:CDS:2, partial [Scutellospora calospora]
KSAPPKSTQIKHASQTISVNSIPVKSTPVNSAPNATVNNELPKATNVESTPASATSSLVMPTSCPQPVKNSGGTPKRFIVKLSSQSAADKHLSILKNCFNKTIEDNPTKSNKNNTNTAKSNKDRVKTINIGKFSGYIVSIDPEHIKYLAGLEGFEDYEEDSEVKLTYDFGCDFYNEPTDFSSLEIYNLDRIDQPNLPLDGFYNFPISSGQGVNVYVIDSGIRIDHVDFNGRATWGATFCSGSITCPDTDDHGHGTHVAGTIGGSYLGVAKNVNLIAVKAFTYLGTGYVSDTITALEYVSYEHDNSDNKNTVINMSLGSPKSAIENYVIDQMTEKGIHCIVAAGNSHDDACKYSPASASTAITVGATSYSDDSVTSFSNYGSCVSLFAPGLNVRSAWNTAPNAVNVISGTSQATPHVALIIGQIGNMPPSDMKDLITSMTSNDVISGLDGSSPNKLLQVPSSSNCASSMSLNNYTSTQPDLVPI